MVNKYIAKDITYSGSAVKSWKCVLFHDVVYIYTLIFFSGLKVMGGRLSKMTLFLLQLFRFGNTAYLFISVAFIQMLKALSTFVCLSISFSKYKLLLF